MSHYNKISCRVAIQVCVGYFPDGRQRHRTFSMRGVNPEASVEAIAEVVRALAPVLVYPITKVRKIVKTIIAIPLDDVEREITISEPVTAMEMCKITICPSMSVMLRATRIITVGAP